MATSGGGGAGGNARPVRPGESLHGAQVTAWLRGVVPDLEGEPEISQFTGGASNWTYRLRYPSHDLILRRPPAGTKAKSAHDMAREHRVQAGLRPVFPRVPRMIALCTDVGVIGAEFYVMERLDGLIPRKDWPREAPLDADGARRVARAAIDVLAELHAVDPSAAGLASLGKGRGYTRRQVQGWEERFVKAKTWNIAPMTEVRRWLLAHVPDDVGEVVIHNDFRLDNLVLDRADPANVVGVLDWEMATIGDPLMDLGSALAYWVEPGDDVLMRSTRRQPTHLPGMPTRREVVAWYLERTGRTGVDFTFYEVFGLFRLAVIAQQIYYRYHHGQTRNPAFRHFWLWVNYLGWRAGRVLRGARGAR